MTDTPADAALLRKEIEMQYLQRPTDPGFAPTIPNLLAHAAENFSQAEFLVDDKRTLTFAQADAASAEIAKGLLALRIGKGTRVGLLMPNTADWVLCWLAAARVGALTQLFSTLYKPAELNWGLGHLDVDTLLVAGAYLNVDFLQRLEEAIPDLAAQTSTTLNLPSHPYLRHIVVWGDCDRPWAIKGAEALKAIAAQSPQIDSNFLKQVESKIAPADLLVTISTSGATAHPKAVVHTHGAAVRVPYAFLDYIDFRPDDRNLVGMPFFWVGGFNVNLIPAMHRGATLVFAASSKNADMLDAIKRHKVTRLPWWPIQMKALLQEAEARGADLSSIRDLANRLVGSASFGMTETFGMHSIEPRTSVLPRDKVGSLGRNLPGVERKIVDLETGLETSPGKAGELYVRGYSVMTGYYKVEREDTFTRDGYFPTADVCSIDHDNYIRFHTRRNDMIKTSGANVAPLEVERVLIAAPSVKEAYVFGLPHPTKGEAVIAVVVGGADGVLDTEAVRQLASTHLSSYKVPQAIVPMDAEAIPRTASGKVNKPSLAQLVSNKVRW